MLALLLTFSLSICYSQITGVNGNGIPIPDELSPFPKNHFTNGGICCDKSISIPNTESSTGCSTMVKLNFYFRSLVPLTNLQDITFSMYDINSSPATTSFKGKTKLGESSFINTTADYITQDEHGEPLGDCSFYLYTGIIILDLSDYCDQDTGLENVDGQQSILIAGAFRVGDQMITAENPDVFDEDCFDHDYSEEEEGELSDFEYFNEAGRPSVTEAYILPFECCDSESDTDGVGFGGSGGISNYLNSEVSITPNPFFDKLVLTNLSIDDEIKVVDINGRQIKNLFAKSSEMTIYFDDNISKGMYFVNIKSLNGKLKTFKLVKS